MPLMGKWMIYGGLEVFGRVLASHGTLVSNVRHIPDIIQLVVERHFWMSRPSSPSNRTSFDIFATTSNAVDKKLRSTVEQRPQTAPSLDSHTLLTNFHETNKMRVGSPSEKRANSPNRRHRPKSKQAHREWRTPYKPPPRHSQPWDERFVLAHPLRPKPLHMGPRDAWTGLTLMPMSDTQLKPIASTSSSNILQMGNSLNDANGNTNVSNNHTPVDQTVPKVVNNQRPSSMALRPHTAPASGTLSTTNLYHAYGSSGQLSIRPNSPLNTINVSTASTKSNSFLISQQPNFVSTASSMKKTSSKTSLKIIAHRQAKLSIFSTIRRIVNSKASALRVLDMTLRTEAVWKVLIEELRRLGSLIRYEDIFFIGALKTPHRAILALMGFVATIIGIDSSWESVKKCIEDKMLVMRNFLQNIKPLAIHPAKLKKAMHYWDEECLSLVEVEAISSICIPATHLASWACNFQIIVHILVMADAQRILLQEPSSSLPPIASPSYKNTQQQQAHSSIRGPHLISTSTYKQPVPPPLLQDRTQKIRIFLNSFIEKALYPNENDSIAREHFGDQSTIRWEVEESNLEDELRSQVIEEEQSHFQNFSASEYEEI